MHNNPCNFYECIFVFSLLFTTNSQWFVFSMLTSFSNKHINAQCMQILGLNNAITCIFINTEYCSVCSCICLFSLHRGWGRSGLAVIQGFAGAPRTWRSPRTESAFICHGYHEGRCFISPTRGYWKKTQCADCVRGATRRTSERTILPFVSPSFICLFFRMYIILEQVAWH